MNMERDTVVFTILVIVLFSTSMYLGVQSRTEIFEMAKALYGMGDFFGGESKLSIYSKLTLFLIIWARNTLVATMNIALGPILGLFPIFTVFLNGYIIGGVTSVVVEKVSLEAALKGLVPHGIIELPTFLYSAVIGLKLGKKAVEHKFKGKELTSIYISSLKMVPKLFAPLLLLAALIEAFITTALLGM